MTDHQHDDPTGDRGSADRRAELLGAALGDDLTPAERRELDRLVHDDPAARDELQRANAIVRALQGADAAWTEVEPPPSLHARVTAATDDGTAPRHDQSGTGTDQDRGRDTVVVPLGRRVVAALLVAASAALLVGAGGGFVLAHWLERPAQGPAGTLGAYEPIAFDGAPDGVEVSASVVAHTWGTETVFEEISGLTTGEIYRVVLVDDDGAEVPAGSFEAVAGPVNCRMTSATVRDDVAAISVRATDGTEVMTSALPDVAAT